MKILPFSGFRYNPAKISQLDDVISPPYDQFREGLDDLLYQRHPYNIARIIMNKEMPQDSATDNRYTRSKALLDRWVQEKVFLQDLQPGMVALDLNQERNRLWRIDNSAAIEELRQAMRDKTVIIADGHHRYEVALAFRRETALRITKAKEWELYGYKLMSFVRLESEGITILPIHRLIHSVINFNPSEFLRRLPEFFAIQELPIVGDKKLSVLEILMEALRKQQLAGSNAFGLYLPTLHKFV